MKKNIRKEITKKIKSGEIKMKEKWRFEARRWELRSLYLLAILAIGLSISGLIYFIQIYDPRELAEFEWIGWQVFWEEFPYYWLGGAIVFWILAIIIWLNLGENYRRGRRGAILVISGIGLLFMAAAILFLG